MRNSEKRHISLEKKHVLSEVGKAESKSYILCLPIMYRGGHVLGVDLHDVIR